MVNDECGSGVFWQTALAILSFCAETHPEAGQIAVKQNFFMLWGIITDQLM